MNKWLNEWKNIWTYDILVAEYQFVGIEYSVSIDTYCKDMELFFYPYISWLVLWFTQQVNQSISHTCKKTKTKIHGYVNVCEAGL